MLNFIKNLFADNSPKPTAEEDLEWMRKIIQIELAGGYRSRDEILESAVDSVDSMDAGTAQAEAERMYAELAAALMEEQKSWPTETDYDRLDAAFQSLEEKGIIARQDFSCCGNCGSYEIWDEVDAVAKAGGPTVGYTFFHQQDTESAADGYGLFLAYGSCEKGKEAALDVADSIIAEMEAHGLTTKWSGKLTERIFVEMDWKRRQDLSAYLT